MTYIWKSFPTPDQSGFELTAREALEQNKENCADMESRLIAVEAGGAAASVVEHAASVSLDTAAWGKRHVINSASPVVITLPAGTIGGETDLVCSTRGVIKIYVEAANDYQIESQLGGWLPSST